MNALQSICLVAIHLTACHALGQHASPPAETKDDLASLAANLSDHSYSVRMSATWKLYEIGPRAGDQLQDLAHGSDMEAALRARRILANLERAYFAGVEISLAFSESSIRWDEAVDLTVTMTNLSAYPARIPVDRNVPTGKSHSDFAQQVGTMLDLSDWLIVRSTRGEAVSLHVDDTLGDRDVAAVVQQRAEAGPGALLTPGEEFSVELPAFNRGWARYRMLDQGVYEVTFAYAPPWNDRELLERRVGFVESNQTQIHVKDSAPSGVSRGREVAELTIERRGPTLSARIANKTDQPMIINTNFGIAPPLAQGNWVYSYGRIVREIPVTGTPDGGAGGIAEDRLIEVNPGTTEEVARISTAAFRKALKDAGVDLPSGSWSIHFSYVNDWSSRRLRGAEEMLRNLNFKSDALRANLLRWILSARHSSNRIVAPMSKVP